MADEDYGEMPEDRPAPHETPVAAVPPVDFLAYLRENSKMLFGVLSTADMTAVDNKLLVAVSKQAAFLATDTTIAAELKAHATTYFGRDMLIRFVDGQDRKADTADTIDDFMQEAKDVFHD